RFRASAVWPGLSGHPHAWAYAGALCVALQAAVPVHWRSSLVGARHSATRRFTGLLLVLMEPTGSLDGQVAAVCIYVGSARARTTHPLATGAHGSRVTDPGMADALNASAALVAQRLLLSTVRRKYAAGSTRGKRAW